MDYPTLPPNLHQATYSDLSRAEFALRQYKNVTILGIPHWTAIPQLQDAAKRVRQDRQRVLRELKQRPEFKPVIKTLSQAQTPAEIQKGDRVRVEYRNINSLDREIVTGEGVVIEIQSSRVGIGYVVRLDNGTETPPLDRNKLERA